MPAAAVIPALIAYIKVVAVKELVVGLWSVGGRSGVSRALVALLFRLEARGVTSLGRLGNSGHLL